MEKEILSFAKVIGEPTRARILHQLKNQSCVGELWQCLDLPQNLVSHHLKVLKDAGLVDSTRVGLKSVYSVNKKNLDAQLKSFTNYL